MRSLWALLTLVACSDYRVKPVDSSPNGSGDCAACETPVAEATVHLADASCLGPVPYVADPYEMEVKLELFIDLGEDTDHYGGLQPVVGDLDGDGLPEAVVTDYAENSGLGRVAVFDAGGAILWERPVDNWSRTLLLADVDGRDGAEVIAGICDDPGPEDWAGTCPNSRTAALSSADDELWSIPREGAWNEHCHYETAGVADLEGDGHPVLLCADEILDLATGTLRGVLDFGADNPWSYSYAFADADGDGILEIAAQGRLFEADGTLRWAVSGSADVVGTVVVQADADDLPEFLFFRDGWKLVDSDGSVIATVELDESLTNEALPSIADFDGDGEMEIVVELRAGVAAYDLDGTRVWARSVNHEAYWGGWDFDGDGAVEVIVIQGIDNDVDALHVLDGRTGNLLYELTIANVSQWSPFAADIDNDGHAELLFAGGTPREGPLPSVTILHQVNDTWPAAGPSWPGRDFQVNNIGPAGEVPRGETNPPWWAYNVFHARPATNALGMNLTPSIASVCSCEDTVEIQVQVTNTGAETSPESVFQLQAGETVVSETTVPSLAAGSTTAGVVLTVPASTFDLGEVRVVTDVDALVVECDEEDNELVIADPR